ncbi:MAG: NAD-binding protein, partial [Phycisphaerales bacterium]|nr:NAD-binding protein [Phycisphaerales bacterium]
MNIIICGAGQVGAHAADVLARSGHNVTVIDTQIERVRAVEDRMDVRTLRGDAASARVLLEGDTGRGDLLIAATDADDINVLTASVAKGLGCREVIARVHHRTFFEAR